MAPAIAGAEFASRMNAQCVVSGSNWRLSRRAANSCDGHHMTDLKKRFSVMAITDFAGENGVRFRLGVGGGFLQ
jgi:hypothetical protein